MRRALVLLVALMALVPGAGPARAQVEKTSAKAATEPVVKQLEAFRRDDFDTAYTFASDEIRSRFDRRSFEAMVRRGYPEIARSAFASVVTSEMDGEGLAYVTVTIGGANGKTIEAVYEVVWEDGWKINGVATRPTAEVI